MIAVGALLVSLLVLLVVFGLDGTHGRNRFGDDPKGVSYQGVFE